MFDNINRIKNLCIVNRYGRYVRSAGALFLWKMIHRYLLIIKEDRVLLQSYKDIIHRFVGGFTPFDLQGGNKHNEVPLYDQKTDN